MESVTQSVYSVTDVVYNYNSSFGSYYEYQETRLVFIALSIILFGALYKCLSER